MKSLHRSQVRTHLSCLTHHCMLSSANWCHWFLKQKTNAWTYKRLSPVVLLHNTMLINNRRRSVQHQNLLINLKTLEDSWFYFNVPLIAKLISSDCKRTIPAHKKYLPPWLKYLKWKSGAICLKKLPWNSNGYANIINECHKTPDIWRVQWSNGDLCRKIVLLITLSV